MATRIINAPHRPELQFPESGVPLIARIAKMATTYGLHADEALDLAWDLVKMHRLGIYPIGYTELKAAAEAAAPLNVPAALAH